MKLFDNVKAFFNNYEDEDYVSSYIDDEDQVLDTEDLAEEAYVAPSPRRRPVAMKTVEPKFNERKTFTMETSGQDHMTFDDSKVLDFNRLGSQYVVIVKPTAIEDGQEIANELKAGRIVICNFEDLDNRRAQRIIDFLTGSAFSLGGKVMPISDMIFAITPVHIQLQQGLEVEREDRSIRNLRDMVNAL